MSKTRCDPTLQPSTIRETTVKIRTLVLRTLLAFPSVLASGLSAQDAVGTAALQGRITDAGGKPIEGVAVVISPLDRRTLTNAAGEFSISGLSARPVEIRFESFGFGVRETQVSLFAGKVARVDVSLESSAIGLAPLTVTARRIEERVQDVPIPIAVVSGALMERAGNFNVNRLQQAVPTIQFYTTNPRNSFLNIRGLGLPFGLANDGIEPGVGLYVDGVFHSRPAAATLDFLDVERIEVLRGPQGTLFGKNTTAGALNVTSRRPNLVQRETGFELSYGNLGFIQAKASITGPLSTTIAGRLSFSGTHRDGTLHNVRTDEDVNTLDNLGAKGQLTFLPRSGVVITAAADFTRQRPNGYAPVVAGVAPTLRAATRQFPRFAADLGYSLPSTNPFDRLIDTDTPWRSNQDYGGASVTAEWALGAGQLTSITAWRAWNWDPSNDRDFTGLPITTLSQAPSLQKQWTQELRYAAKPSPGFDFVVGAFGFLQTLDGTITLESGSAAARWNLAPSNNAATPGLLDGYGQRAEVDFRNASGALFGQLQWELPGHLRVLPGIRLNFDRKEGDYDQTVYGGLQTSNPALVSIQKSIYSAAAYHADVSKTNLSGQTTLAFTPIEQINAYATWATSFKSVGLNIAGGLPIVPATGLPDPTTAVVRPEDEHHLELGLKTTPFPGVTANLSAFDTEVKDYQTTVFGGDPSALRGYLANAEKVRVRGVEFDGTASLGERVFLHGTAALTDGRNEIFTKAPASLEGTGGPQFVDISGSELAGLSRWSFSFGGDYAHTVRGTEISLGLESSYRSSFSSSPTPSDYLRIDGYGLVNGRVGLSWGSDWSVTFWSRNLPDKDYFEILNPVGGNTGIYVGFLGDPRTFGVTLKRVP